MAAGMLSLPLTAQNRPVAQRKAATETTQKGLGLPMLSAKGHLDAGATANAHKVAKRADASDVIYSQDFNNSLAGISGMTVIDANMDGKTWDWYGNRARCEYHRTNKMDDWLISPAIHLEGGKVYRLAIKGQAYSDRYAESFEVKLGNAADPSAMTITAIEPQVVKSDVKQEFTNNSILIPETGDYYIGVHGISDPDAMYLYVDDIVLSGGTEATLPGVVTDLVITPAVDASLKAQIKFTAPTTLINGNPLTEAMTITIKRDGETIKQYTDIAPGTQLTYADTTVPTAGEHEYTIVASISGIEGDATTVTAYVGLDVPAALTDIAVEDYSDVLRFSYGAISNRGLHNGAVIAKDVVVDLYSVNVSDMGSASLNELVDSSNNGYIDVEEETNTGEQSLQYWALQPWNNAGNGPMEFVPAFIGAPSATPYYENFKGRKFNNFWTYDISSASVQLSYSSVCSDEDGAAIAFRSVAGNEWGFIESGKIDIKGQKAATLSLDIMGESANTVTVEAIGPDGKYTKVATLPVTDQYATHAVDLTAFNAGDFVRLRITADMNVAGSVFIDNICALNQLDNNAAIIDAYVEQKPVVGEECEVLVSVSNYGKNVINGYSLTIYANGRKMTESPRKTGLESMQTVTELVTFTPDVFCTGTLEITAEVVAANDEQESDNAFSFTVEVNRSTEDQPEGFTVVPGADAAALSWDAANDTPKVVTEDFESYTPWVVEPNEPYATTTLGPWTMINNDQSYAGPLYSSFSMPCEFQTFAYVVTNMDEVIDPDYGEYPGHSGRQFLSAFYGYDIETLDMETGDMEFAESNDWLISPELSGRKQTISFWYQAPGPDAMPEYFYIQTSKTDKNLRSFSPLTDLVAVSTSEENTDWKKYSVSLPEGTKFFAINRNDGADDGLWFMIDDITYEKLKKIPTAYRIYVDGVLVAELPGTAVSYSAPLGTEYSITAVYEGGLESEPVTVSFDPDGINSVAADAATAAPRFNLSGQRISSNYRGVFVTKGKKMVKK